jgi:two-component system, NtrC family, response regulator AtoC
MSVQSNQNLLPVETPVPLGGPSYFVYGISPAMSVLKRVVAEIAPTDLPVLLTGESGTGKEALALDIHRLSQKREKSFLKHNCLRPMADFAPLNPIANRRERRADETGNVGSLFLDEISQLDAAGQMCLLQLLFDGDQADPSRRLGPRVISATRRNLEQERQAGRFQAELYYRLNAVSLSLPALRDRKDDIPELLDLSVRKYVALFDRPQPHLSSRTLDLLLRYSWPGNVRELENVARKIVLLGDEQLALSDIAADNGSSMSMSSATTPPEADRHKPSLKQVSREASQKAERNLIRETLIRTHWNRKRTARELQISYKALLYKVKQMDLDGGGESPTLPGGAGAIDPS